jgi:anaerobic selenocysteine-containing dehydrogenase
MAVPDRIANPWGERTPLASGDRWSERVDQHLTVEESEVEAWVPAASVLHSNGDGYHLAVANGRIVGVRGRGDDRVNRGRLGPKDLFAWQATHSPDRLTRPLVRMASGELEPVDWDAAMGLVVERSKELLAEAGSAAFGFYTTGQLFLEEYYAQALVARAGIGTNHLDGNTRLCTATAAEAMKLSFGSDGQPGSYDDINHADTIALYGHNMAATQPVLWMRVLDRRAGPDPPTLIAVDPRTTAVAREADIHLALRPGTNLALLNAIVRELIANDWVDHDYVEAHTVGFEELERMTSECTPEWAEGVTGVTAAEIRRAAEAIGRAERLLSTLLQGVYQSHQATGSAVQVNNVHLLRGMLGRPGCGVLQMNGQPTAQNTRECGANGDLPGFRNWQNEAQVEELARLWNVDPLQIPHWSPPTHTMEIFRYCEQGSIRMLWITGTNPAVSLPELERVRSILGQERLFVVVQDIFMSETAELADVVLPAATLGEKTGTFTNAERTVHLAEKAVDPPGEARPDLEIFLDYARRMGFRDRDGEPLVKFDDSEGAFEAWKECSRGRPCDYSGLSYAKLRERGGVQWPCTDEAPDGTERLYTDGRFFAMAEECESYGKDLLTGALFDEAEYRAANPDGRAMLRGCEYTEPREAPDDEYPLALTTGRTIYHFHTRTKTARAPELHAAEPEPWVELAPSDAEAAGVGEGDQVEVVTPRGRVRAPARLTGVLPGVVFLPFHYGYWDAPDADRDRAANELTITAWDPASRQPLFKAGKARVQRV